MHGGGVSSGAAINEPTFVACMLLLPTVVRSVSIYLAAAEGVMLRAVGVLKPYGFSSTANAKHWKGAMGASQRAVINLANNKGAGLTNGGSSHLFVSVVRSRGCPISMAAAWPLAACCCAA